MLQRCKYRHIHLGFTSEEVPEGQHICYIFSDEQERRHVMSEYLKMGLEEGEKVLYLVDSMTTDEFTECMAELGLYIENSEKDFALSDALPVYCPEGVFNKEQMLEVVEEFYINSIGEGYVGARGTGEMTWSLEKGKVKKQDLIEYEARLNDLLLEYPITACCQYDAKAFDGETIMEVLQVHPMMIVKGQIVKNPFYTPPSEYLKKFEPTLL